MPLKWQDHAGRSEKPPPDPPEVLHFIKTAIVLSVTAYKKRLKVRFLMKKLFLIALTAWVVMMEGCDMQNKFLPTLTLSDKKHNDYRGIKKRGALQNKGEV